MADQSNTTTPPLPSTTTSSSKDEGYAWLSNFSAHEITLDGLEWPTVEHYFQAQKFPEEENYMETIRNAKSPAQAKSLGASREYNLREDWEEAKEKVMREALVAKFTQHEDMRERLLATGNKKLVERADNDAYWGDGKHGHGKNRLGVLIMEVRDAIKSGALDNIKDKEEEEAASSNSNEEEEVDVPVMGAPVKTKSHTTAPERAAKRKLRNKERRNVWKDATGASVFQIEQGDPQTAVLFKDADVTVPMTALPEPAKHVMRKHQFVLKWSDKYEDEEDEEDFDEEQLADLTPSKRVTLGAFIAPTSGKTQKSEALQMRDASEGIATAQSLMRAMSAHAPHNDAYKAHRAQCLELLPLLFGFVEQPQSDSVMMALLETIDALNTCSAM